MTFLFQSIFGSKRGQLLGHKICTNNKKNRKKRKYRFSFQQIQSCFERARKKSSAIIMSNKKSVALNKQRVESGFVNYFFPQRKTKVFRQDTIKLCLYI